MPRRPNIIDETSPHEASAGLDSTMSITMEEDNDSENTSIGGDNTLIKTEADDDSNQVSALGKLSKSSRRKQSKPIRVSYIDLEASGEGSANRGQQQQVPQEGGNVGAAAVGGPVAGNCSSSPSSEDSYGCDLCQGTFPSQDLLKEHIQRVHITSSSAAAAAASDNHDSKKRHQEDAEMQHQHQQQQQFPTKYHQLGNELLQVSGYDQLIKHEQAEDYRKYENDCTADSSGDMKDNGSDSGSKSDRIFHQDAYCELCDREFCNKYFLKTHKANKHGIYDSSIAPPPPYNDSMPYQSFAGPPSMVPQQEPLSLVPQQQQPQHQQLLQQEASSSATGSPIVTPPAEIKHIPTPTPNQPTYDEGTNSNINTKNPTTPNTLSTTTTTPTETKKSVAKPGERVSPDMEDYCEHCQKHFCNKYYLKKHKQDVHGIIPDQPAQKRSRNNAPLDYPKVSTPSSSPMLMPPSMPPVTSMGNVMLINPFLSHMALLPPGMFGAQPHPGHLPPQLASHMNFSQPPPPPPPHHMTPPPLVESPEKVPTPTPSNSTPQNIQIPNDALRSIGVLNADAYCEICRKEFCNKYFLRIHKANKHGIYTEDMNKKSPAPLLVPYMPANTADPGAIILPSSGSQELDLSMHRRNQEKDDADDRPPYGYDSETFCELCNREMPNKYSLRFHKINIHGVLPESEPGELPRSNLNHGAEDLVMKRSMPPQSAPPPMPQSQQHQQQHQQPPQHHQGPPPPPPHEEQPPQIESRLPPHKDSHFARMEEQFNLSQNEDRYRSPSSKDNGIKSTMFGNMVVAKLADRVMCDICNKEVCNKYFLKTHKLKVHGVDPNQDAKDKADKEKKMENERIKAKLAENILEKRPDDAESNLSGVFSQHSDQLPEKPNHEELVRLGIDPEAYCEICKKEFCSKYFLRTHKQNIHGLKTPFTPVPPMKKTPLSDYNASMNKIYSSTLVIPTPPPPSKINPGEQRSWKWKEPLNHTRVVCDICNKEVCNKYFLRTHKINKHGIYIDVSPPGSISGQMMCSNSNGSLPDSDCSQSSVVQNLSLKFNAEKKEHDNGKIHSEGELSTEGEKDIKFSMFDENQMINNQYYNSYSEVCHLCDRRFKSSKWLKAHLLNDHGVIDDISIRKTANAVKVENEPIIQKCEVCGMLFGDKITLQLHLIQDHQAKIMLQPSPDSSQDARLLAEPQSEVPGQQVQPSSADTPALPSLLSNIGLSLKRKYRQNVKHKLYSCSQCDYKTRWLSNIYSHEQRKHNSANDAAEVACKECSRTFRYQHSLARHMEEVHNQKPPTESNEDESLANHSAAKRKKFCCAQCGVGFSSRTLCQAHIQVMHPKSVDQSGIKVRGGGGGQGLAGKRFICSKCPFITRFPKNLRNHMILKHKAKDTTSCGLNNGDDRQAMEENGNNNAPVGYATPYDLTNQSSFIMQPFTVKEEEASGTGNFVTSVVYFPVRKKVTESVAVSFTLNPTE